ncbi:class I glutamine amidotransferase-like protein [Ceraceosorus guamensis]|uniref:Class I glutamine amidotransferase-like protein n=1 Tax=Ceraceosorus guamensis TaxID=1522189 RepID=A0A316VWD2_9BASI|nr:class I glutamine amidotransferase-like protein [Ceraceosorus guamensis]PWN41926.1 class I glutamine amidotransferase-like protein [Ceraceosorus guamensis]
MGHKTLSIALLLADTPPAAVVAKRGDYKRIYPQWLNHALSSIPRHAWQDTVELDIIPFDVVQQHYPEEGQLKDGIWDAVIVTGSASSAYADVPWTNKLSCWLKHTAYEHPLVRIIGICYGHQIIARALDAPVKLNEHGFELGVYEVELSDEGKEYLGYEHGEGIMRIHQVHRDIVASAPPDFQGQTFENLGSTSRCSVQGLALRYPTDAPPLPSAVSSSDYIAFDISSVEDSSGPAPSRSLHILTLQGHPEFDAEIVETLIDARTEMGLIQGDLRREGLERAKREHDGARIGRAVLAMLGVEAKRTEEGTVGDGGVGV